LIFYLFNLVRQSSVVFFIILLCLITAVVVFCYDDGSLVRRVSEIQGYGLDAGVWGCGWGN